MLLNRSNWSSSMKAVDEMQIIDQTQIDAVLDFDSLIIAIQKGFAQQFTMPKRNVYELDKTDTNHDAFAVLPAWNEQVIGVKAFTYFPSNADSDYASLHSKIILFSRAHGEPLALVDGTRVTLWRTAAVSALASYYLSRKDSQHLVFFGTGNLADYMIRAHLSVRNFKRVTLIGRDQKKVARLQNTLQRAFTDIEFVIGQSCEDVINSADVISCATGSPTPLFSGCWLMPGTHVDLIGNHHRESRECDSVTVTQSKVYVDSKVNVLAEAGELLIPISEGVFDEANVCGELAELAAENNYKRENESDITVFKSVGTALSDLITAHYIYKSLKNE